MGFFHVKDRMRFLFGLFLHFPDGTAFYPEMGLDLRGHGDHRPEIRIGDNVDAVMAERQTGRFHGLFVQNDPGVISRAAVSVFFGQALERALVRAVDPDGIDAPEDMLVIVWELSEHSGLSEQPFFTGLPEHTHDFGYRLLVADDRRVPDQAVLSLGVDIVLSADLDEARALHFEQFLFLAQACGKTDHIHQRMVFLQSEEILQVVPAASFDLVPGSRGRGILTEIFTRKELQDGAACQLDGIRAHPLGFHPVQIRLDILERLLKILQDDPLLIQPAKKVIDLTLVNLQRHGGKDIFLFLLTSLSLLVTETDRLFRFPLPPPVHVAQKVLGVLEMGRCLPWLPGRAASSFFVFAGCGDFGIVLGIRLGFCIHDAASFHVWVVRGRKLINRALRRPICP